VDANGRLATVLGVTAGVVGGLVVGLYLFTRTRREPVHPVRDAQDIIAQCHAKIREIESGLGVLLESPVG